MLNLDFNLIWILSFSYGYQNHVQNKMYQESLDVRRNTPSRLRRSENICQAVEEENFLRKNGIGKQKMNEDWKFT